MILGLVREEEEGCGGVGGGVREGAVVSFLAEFRLSRDGTRLHELGCRTGRPLILATAAAGCDIGTPIVTLASEVHIFLLFCLCCVVWQVLFREVILRRG